jgi:cbb3-type cytochrome oxidase subunit 3
MAISNNLPIFFDAMQQAIAQQKELQSQGEPSKNALQVLAGGFFTLGTALSVGVTLLTLFGPKIIDAIFNTEKKKKVDEEAKLAIEAKDKAEKEYIDTMVKAGSEEISRSQILFENAKNVNMSMRDRLDAIKQLRERYPDYLGHLTNEQFLSGQTADAENRLNDALMKRGVAIALQGKLTEQYNKLSAVLINIAETQAKSQELTKSDIDLGKKLGVSQSQLAKDKLLAGNLQLAQFARNKTAIEEEINNIFKLYNQYSPYLSAVQESTKAHKKKAKVLKEEEEFNKNSEEALKRSISALEKQLANIDRFNPAYDLINGTLILQKQLYDQLFGTISKGQEETIKGIELTDEAVYADYFAWLKLKEATDDYLKTISSDAFNKAFNNIGLASAKMFFDFDKDGKTTFDKLMEGADSLKEKFAITFQAVGDVAQDIFNKIMELSNQRFENEKANLQKEKDMDILFAGDSASAKEEINRQYDERQREIRNREAKAKKQQAIFNILIDTAQGVVSALATGNIPLSIAIGVIGALQAGIVASQPKPQFYKGTDNSPEGWAWTQEKGAEVITDKNGKLKSTGSNKGAQMTYLNKGDKVFTAEKSKLMFDNGLNNILSSNGISMPKIELNTPNIDVSGVIKAIENKASVNLSIDKGGLNAFVSNGHSRKEITNRRINGIGQNV